MGTNNRIDDIRERRAAVKGKWTAAQTPNDGRWAVLGPRFELPITSNVPLTTQEVAEFIANAPADIDYLLSALTSSGAEESTAVTGTQITRARQFLNAHVGSYRKQEGVTFAVVDFDALTANIANLFPAPTEGGNRCNECGHDADERLAGVCTAMVNFDGLPHQCGHRCEPDWAAAATPAGAGQDEPPSLLRPPVVVRVPTTSKVGSDLVVTRNGVPCPDQKAAIEEFKAACRASTATPGEGAREHAEALARRIVDLGPRPEIGRITALVLNHFPPTGVTQADWCDVCSAPQWVLADGNHACLDVLVNREEAATIADSWAHEEKVNPARAIASAIRQLKHCAVAPPADAGEVERLKKENRDLRMIVDVGTNDDPGTALSKLHKIQHIARANAINECASEANRLRQEWIKQVETQGANDAFARSNRRAWTIWVNAATKIITALESLAQKKGGDDGPTDEHQGRAVGTRWDEFSP